MFTPLYASLCVLHFLYLSFRVVMTRRAAKIPLESGGDRTLQKMVRRHANAAEYVPLALIILYFVEQSAPIWLVHVLGVSLVSARVIHAHGLGKTAGISFGRFWGTLITWTMMLVGALWCLSDFIL